MRTDLAGGYSPHGGREILNRKNGRLNAELQRPRRGAKQRPKEIREMASSPQPSPPEEREKNRAHRPWKAGAITGNHAQFHSKTVSASSSFHLFPIFTTGVVRPRY